jgi:hypothetical protein
MHRCMCCIGDFFLVRMPFQQRALWNLQKCQLIFCRSFPGNMMIWIWPWKSILCSTVSPWTLSWSRTLDSEGLCSVELVFQCYIPHTRTHTSIWGVTNNKTEKKTTYAHSSISAMHRKCAGNHFPKIHEFCYHIALNINWFKIRLFQGKFLVSLTWKSPEAKSDKYSWWASNGYLY